MAVSKAELRKFAKLVADEFLDGKDKADLQGVSQDGVDAFVIPIMSEVEDSINDLIAAKIKDAFDSEPLDPNEDFWGDR